MYAISCVNNGVESNKSYAKEFTTTNSACSTTNDVGVAAMQNPLGGRQFTSTALTSTEKISLIIKNFGTINQNSIPVFYKINNGTTRTILLTDVLTANDTATANFSINEDLSATGSYTIEAWTNLAGDVNSLNDTFIYIIKNLANLPISLPYSNSFENVNAQLTESTFGITTLEEADFYPENGGRLRTNEGNLYAHFGSNAITLDNYIATSAKKNELIFTYNLSNYIDSTLFFDFSYLNRGEPDANDTLFARGSDTLPWVKLLDLYSNKAVAGKYKEITGVNLYYYLKTLNAQNFSSSTQLKIVHSASKSALTSYSDGGYTFDDFKIYNGGKDIAIKEVVTKKINCSKNVTQQPVSIKIINNAAQPISNIAVSYQVNTLPSVTEVCTTMIQPQDSFIYTFSTPINNTAIGKYAIKAWCSANGDNFKTNDTTIESSIFVLATIDSFPYYNDFETNNGNVFSEGKNNSWAWGTPSKYDIDNAAQESKAWTTGLNTGYNFNENSYLYFGCLDVSSLTVNPLLSFNLLSVLQPSSDSAYVEYSTNGLDWKRLGCSTCGLNWYGNTSNKPYWENYIFPWQVAHIQIPLDSLQDKSNFIYRIHLMSDNFYCGEGIGIDDIHIQKNYAEIAPADSSYISGISTGNGWVQFYKNGNIVAEFFDDHKVLGNISVGFEANTTKHKVFQGKNIFPRNWVIIPQNNLVGNYKLRLYVLNTEYKNYVIAEDSISRMGDIGLLRYIGLNTNLNNIDNHITSYYKYFSPSEIQFYPTQSGYYVELNTDTLGEFYLLSTKQDASAKQFISLLDFKAKKLNNDVYLEWKTSEELGTSTFVIQYSFDGINFINIDTLPAGGYTTTTMLYNFIHQLNTNNGVYYYRIKIVNAVGQSIYSLIDSVHFSPSTVGIQQNTISFKSYLSENDILIELKNSSAEQGTIIICNNVGQVQYKGNLKLQNGVHPLGIKNFKSWSNGIYYLELQTTTTNYYSKFLKE